MSLTAYEKLKSVSDQKRTAASYKKPILPALCFTSWAVRRNKSHHIFICYNIKCSPTESSKIHTFRGWLIVLHKSSLPVLAFTFTCIFALFAILLPAGLTKSGKVNGTFNENSPLRCTSFWDQLSLIDKLLPPSNCCKCSFERNYIRLWWLKHKNAALTKTT